MSSTGRLFTEIIMTMMIKDALFYFSGKLYSMMMMKVALAHILRRYHVTGDIDSVVVEFDIVLKPVEGQHISLTQRT